MNNSKLLKIVEYLSSSDQELAGIGFELLNNADLTIEYKLSVLTKAGFKLPEVHKKKGNMYTYPHDGKKSYSYEYGIFVNRTYYPPGLESYSLKIMDISK